MVIVFGGAKHYRAGLALGRQFVAPFEFAERGLIHIVVVKSDIMDDHRAGIFDPVRVGNDLAHLRDELGRRRLLQVNGGLRRSRNRQAGIDMPGPRKADPDAEAVPWMKRL